MNPICIIDDEASITSTVASILKDEGYQAIAFEDAESFWEKLDALSCTGMQGTIRCPLALPGLFSLQQDVADY